MRPSRCTMKDVARVANVSVATVSRVINNVETVEENLRKRVLEAIDELGFQPNYLAKSLKNNSTNTIGVVVSDISNPFFIGVARQIEKVVRDKGYTMFMASTDSDHEKELEIIRMMVAKRVDGIIISPDSNELEKVVRNLDCPTVAIDRKSLNNICDTVYTDKEVLMYKAVKHLAQKGHKNIAMVTGPKELSSNRDRFNGYFRAHYDLGMDVDISNIIFSEFTMETGKKAFKELMSKEKRPSAIIAGNALIAQGFISKAKDMNLRIPEDVSIISFGEIENQEIIEPVVSHFKSLKTEIGQVAGQMIINRIKHPDAPIRIEVLDVDITEGDSVKSLK